PSVVAQSLGALRVKLAHELGLIDEDKLNFLWVTDWPLLEYDEDEKRYVAAHHPFTSPKDEDLDKLDSEPERAQAKAYDIVLNGYELGGGSIRIH
ncbi:aspartate--tRNA ligase, partial [Klebsiella pneumoniae]|nr:aspartate--tRNA ligase [Klebsiella pneumoniae]